MSETHNTDPKLHYDNITKAWRFLLGDSFHFGYFDSEDQPLNQATNNLTKLMASHAKLKSSSQVLDIGCGIGDPARDLAKKYACNVTGISTSEVGIELANSLSKAENLDHSTQFFVRDGMCNGFDDEQFDCIWIMESSHLMPDKRAMINDAARVLRPEGKLVLCDIIAPTALSFTDIFRKARQFDLLSRVFGKAESIPLDEYEVFLTEANLKIDHKQDISKETESSFDQWYLNSQNNASEVKSLIGEKAWQDFADSCDVLRSFWSERILGYGIITASK